jgi:hypothetical protein
MAGESRAISLKLVSSMRLAREETDTTNNISEVMTLVG